ncbi:hypothetical protein [Nocardia rhamnosiphila]|uniref:Scaffolding protein n=1 Tax=Nocardia rhamnosiphila TaxID=426716 RepID=A0ABV2WZ17_9NOCA
MTEPITDTAAAEPTATDAPPAEVDSTEREQQGGNQEAKKWRLKLRDTEAERDGLRERVATYERTEVERLVADRLADPADLWVAGTELDALRGKDGAIDPAKVKESVDALLEQRPHWKRATRSVPRPGGLKSGATSSGDTMATSWQSAFGAARRK